MSGHPGHLLLECMVLVSFAFKQCFPNFNQMDGRKETNKQGIKTHKFWRKLENITKKNQDLCGWGIYLEMGGAKLIGSAWSQTPPNILRCPDIVPWPTDKCFPFICAHTVPATSNAKHISYRTNVAAQKKMKTKGSHQLKKNGILWIKFTNGGGGSDGIHKTYFFSSKA